MKRRSFFRRAREIRIITKSTAEREFVARAARSSAQWRRAWAEAASYKFTCARSTSATFTSVPRRRVGTSSGHPTNLRGRGRSAKVIGQQQHAEIAREKSSRARASDEHQRNLTAAEYGIARRSGQRSGAGRKNRAGLSQVITGEYHAKTYQMLVEIPWRNQTAQLKFLKLVVAGKCQSRRR